MLRQRLRFSARIGLLVAVVLSTIVTIVEWWQNPGGIYRAATGTDWRIVWETWTSWFVPTLLTVFAVGVAVVLVLFLIGRITGRSVGRSGPDAESADQPGRP